MSISSEDIKKLRDQTQAGMMDCKKALVETGGNYQEAVEWLRKKGLATAASRAGKAAAEGAVAVFVDGIQAAIIELNSETDFVAKNADFQKAAEEIVQLACKDQLSYTKLLEAKYPHKNVTVAEEVTELVGKIKENINLRRSDVLKVSDGAIASYIHNAFGECHGKIGVLVGIESSLSSTAKLVEIGKKIAMHIAATRPKALNIEELSQAEIETEKRIFTEQAKQSGKPDDVIAKMIEGRIRKFYEEVVLLEQPFVLDSKLKVKDFIAQEAKTLGTDITLKGYIYYVLGEGIEVEQKDFAKEVQEQINR